MKLTTLINIFSFFIIVNPIKSQINEKFHYKDKYSSISRLDSLLRNQNALLDDTYFVITFPVHNPVSSFAMQLHKAYHTIRDKNLKIVLLLLNEDGVRKKDIDNLLKQLLKVDDDEYKKILVVNNSSIYNYVVKNKELVRLLYIYRNNIHYDANQKLHTFNTDIIRNKKIEIKHVNSVKLKGIDSFLIKKVDPLISYKENHLLLLGDVTNVLYDIEVNTGEVKPIFDIKKYLTPYDVYNSEIANWDTVKYNFAKKYNNDLIKKNRQTIQLSKVKYQNNKIYGTFSIEVMEKNDNDYTYISDEGKTVTIKKEAHVLSNYLFFFNWNPLKKEINSIAEIKNPVEDTIYTNVDCGFYVTNDSLFTAVTRYIPMEKEAGHIALYRKINDELMFTKFIGPNTKTENDYSYYHSKDFFIKFNEKLLYCYNYLGEICEVGNESKIGQLFGDGSKPYDLERYKKVSEENLDTSRVNFEIHDVQSILGSQYLLAAYLYKGEYIFELKDKELKTQDIIEMKKTDGFQNYMQSGYSNNLLIKDNKIYYLALENEDLYLKIFEISKL